MCLLAALCASACGAANTPSSITLEWTAPGDDALTGSASLYDLRYSSSQVGADTLAWWNAASSATGLPAPSPAGQTDSATVTSLIPETTYYFILRSYDDGGNSSGYSNVASSTTGAEFPETQPGCEVPASPPTQFHAAVDSGDVVLSWTPSGDPLSTALHVWRASGSNSLTLLTTLTDLSQTGYRDTTVRPGRTYRYRATWADSCGDGPATSSVWVNIPASSTTPSAATSDPEPALHAYPNPSTSTDAVRFVIHVEGSSEQIVRIRLYDLTGRVIADIANGAFPAGDTVVSWPRISSRGDRVAPGYYESIGTVGLASVRERLILLP